MSRLTPGSADRPPREIVDRPASAAVGRSSAAPGLGRHLSLGSLRCPVRPLDPGSMTLLQRGDIACQIPDTLICALLEGYRPVGQLEILHLEPPAHRFQLG